MSIAEIRVLSLACESLANEVGVGASTDLVEFTGKLLARLDSGTSKSQYGNQYKFLFADSTGYIYVNANLLTYYDMAAGIGEFYRIVGNPSIYIGEAEVVLKNYYTAPRTEIDLSTLAEEMDDISEIHQYASSLRLNNKGVAFSKIVTFEAAFLGKADNAVLLFCDGINAIYVHGDNYVGNRFTINSSYRLIAAVTMFNFRPGVEFIDRGPADNKFETEIEASSLPLISGNELYNYKYETDENSSYPNYSSKFTHLYRYEGYVSLYTKSGSDYIVLEDTYHENFYATYQNAAAAKTIFAKNIDCVDLYSDADFLRCPFNDYLGEDIKIQVVFVPYLWNTSNYWQGYFLTKTISSK